MNTFDGIQNGSVEIPGQRNKKISVKLLLITLPGLLIAALVCNVLAGLTAHEVTKDHDNVSEEA